MTPKIVDYSKSVIYKIEHVDNPELLYVGSTTDFIRRKSQHKRSCNNINGNMYNLKLYQLIRDNGNFDNFKCIIIKEFPCNSRTELLIEEENHRKELQANLNSNRAYLSIDENKEQQKIFRSNNKDKAKIYNHLYQNKYYEINKIQINEKDKEKMTCQCGSIFRIAEKSRHYKSIKHNKFIQQNELK